MRLLGERSEDIMADVHLTLLRIAYPAFRFTVHRRRDGRPRWVAVRRDILTFGMHTIVTGSLDELLAALDPPDLSYQAATRDLAEVVDLCSRPTGSSRRARPSRLAPPTSGKRS
jgi:hypothetical protein